MKRQEMKTKLQYIITGLILVTMLFTMFLSNNFVTNITLFQAKAESLNNSDMDTNFMYSPSSIASFGEITLVLDTNQNSIIKIKDNKILQGENSVTSAYGATHMYGIDKYLVLLSITATTPSEMIRILNSENFEEVIIAQSLDSSLTQGYTNVSSYTINNTLYILLYSLSSTNGIDKMLQLSISLQGNAFTISTPRNLTINTNLIGNNFQENIKSLNIVYNEEQNCLSCLVHSNTDVFGFNIKDNDEISSLSGSDISPALLEDVKNIYIQAYDNNSYIIFDKQSKIEIYSLQVPDLLNDKFMLSSNKVELETTFQSISDIAITDNQLVICSKSDQKIASALISSENGTIVLNSLNYSVNPSVKTTLIDNTEIKLMEITNDTSVNLTKEPYMVNSIITLSPETKVVEIGYGEIYYGEYIEDNAEVINGYKYYLATVNGDNYYGYLPISAVTKLNYSESLVPYAYTKKNVNIYKYPSNTLDDKNTVLTTLSEITKVELINDISEFKYTVGTNGATRTFYEVRYNDIVGYIVSTDIDKFPEITLVQTNATITRNVQVYEQISDELPTWSLSVGARVRILENRYGNEKYTKIAFNDDDGVTCTGYVLSDSVQADSWSTLQIIGFVLVLFSIVLLVIILIVRNRVNHE